MLKKEKILLIAIIVLAVFLRVYGINWDQNQHFHPDERFLTMVGQAMKVPSGVVDYLNPQKSTFNPYNIGNNFFVYGTFPLTLNKLLALNLKLDNYTDFTLLGRFLSSLFDVGTMILVYKVVELWERKHKLDRRLKYLSAFFYSIAVLPIQHSHFFVTENFLNFFAIASFYFALRFFYFWGGKGSEGIRVVYILLSAVFFGMAVGTKISALYILPLIIFFIVLRPIREKQFIHFLIYLFIYIAISYLTLRVADPKFFADGNFLNFEINPIFINNIKELSNLSGPNALYFPPAIQWFGKKPIIFALTNIAFFGLGIPYFLLMTIGIYHFLKEKKVEFYAILFWFFGFFLYQSTRFSPSIRYFIFLYPFFAIFSAWGFLEVVGRLGKYGRSVGLGVLILVLIWPVSFMSIYSRPHSRVQASYWIHQNIPGGVYFAEEHWDDWLPVGLPDIKNRIYEGEQMPVFGPDTPEKWQQMDKILDRADYIIFTSNRGYGSITPQSKMYPKMSQFYKNLFAGKLQFKKIKEFTSYPMFDDQWSDEAFTVYDHPKVTILKKID